MGALAGIALAHLWSPSTCRKKPVGTTKGDLGTSDVWNDRHFKDGGAPGFTVRGPPTIDSVKDDATEANKDKAASGVDVFLEKWTAGSSEPPHSRPGDDQTTVIEGKMVIQFFTKGADGKLVKDGSPVELAAGQSGFIKADRIHDARYLSACKLVYVHNRSFGFAPANKLPADVAK